MADAVIENPILNLPFDEPTRHWKFERDGITNEVVEGRRVSSYFMPIPKSRRGGNQMQFETEWTSDRIEENRTINRIRERVGVWRHGGWPGVTPTTRRLLDYWTDPARDRKLFFAQIEAVETAIYIGEVINKAAHQDAWITNFLRDAAEDANPGLFRVALKMATGTGKTVVMAMLIAWQALNKTANKQDARFSDAFLLVSPGIMIRDRLRVLLPESPDNYYRERDLIPPGEHDRLGQARIVVTNFHGFLLRDRSGAPKLTKQVLAGRGRRQNPLQETPDQMARRVCRALGSKRGIIVINDEAHHCYRYRVGGEAEDFFPGARTAESKREVKEREEQARVWISGLEAVDAKVGIKSVYDLSATPFFLAGSGYPEGRLFPWVVSKPHTHRPAGPPTPTPALNAYAAPESSGNTNPDAAWGSAARSPPPWCPTAAADSRCAASRGHPGAYVQRYHHRPHQFLGYRTPKEVRQTWEDAQETETLRNQAA